MPASGGSIHHSTACSGVVPRLHCLLHIADYIILQQGQDQFIIVLITVIKKNKVLFIYDITEVDTWTRGNNYEA